LINPGTLLIAHPKFTQGIFGRSVVLITEHHSQGSVGFILNKPTQFKVKDIIDSIYVQQIREMLVHSGGPVNPRAVCLLHSDEWYSLNTMHICSGISLTSDRKMIDKFNTDNTPEDFIFSVGMATWHPGQLENELSENNASRHPLWLTTELDDYRMIFNCSKNHLWNKCLDICTRKIVSQYF
jgi:putative transcriptional regulator